MRAKMPQEGKRNGKRAKRAAKASISLRNSAKGQKSRVLKGAANFLADSQLKKAMAINKATRDAKTAGKHKMVKKTVQVKKKN